MTTALVVGAASTTFAAANPFSDVPADHWAYDAVAQLAADGVIEGYGDTTFQGDKNITRYEMAQMVAKAMAKHNVPSNDKALVDKLAAEFADERNNLGVRVSNLEKHADMVKWNGKLEYTYTSYREKYDGVSQPKENDDNLLFRLTPTAEVNDHWTIGARLDANTKMDTDTGVDGGNVKLKRVWADGQYKTWSMKFGKFQSDVNNTLVFDNPFSGFQVNLGKGSNFTAILEAGRIGKDDTNEHTVPYYLSQYLDKAASYQGVRLGYDYGKLSTAAAYQHYDLNQDKISVPLTAATTLVLSDYDNFGIWSLAAKYAFDHNVALNAEYAHSDLTDPNKYTSDKENRSYAVEVYYKGAQAENKGTWGAWLAYRYLGAAAAIAPTYDAITADNKGWELGGEYALFKNILATLRYGDNKYLSDNNIKDKTLFGRVEFFF